MNKFPREKLFKALVVLGVLFAFGIPETKALAFLVPLATLLGAVAIEAIWGGISGIAADIAQGIANLIGAVVNMLGSLFYFVASELMDFAIKVNLLIPTSEIIKSGFETTLLVANLGLVLGLIIMAFAIMTRADWLVEARQAIPKFIAAAFLINFGFFITVTLLINPSTAITNTIYGATQYDAESFRGAFQPDLDLRPAMKIRIAIAKHPEDQEALDKYFEFREGMYGVVSSSLRLADEQLYAGGTVVSETQRQIVSRAITQSVIDTTSFNFVGKTANAIAGDNWKFYITAEVHDDLNIAGAPYQGNLVNQDGSLTKKIVREIVELMKASYNCDPPTGCQELVRIADLTTASLDPWEDTAVTFIEVLFESLFVFLGSFSLLGIGVMFIIRYVALSLLVILFPFAWIGWIFPKLTAAAGGKNIWTSWWSQFIKWLIFGPIAMFFFFLAVKGALSIQQLTVPTSLTVEEFHGAGTAGALGTAAGNLAVVLGLLMGGLYTANKLSIIGAKTFYGGALKMRNWVGKQFKKIGKAPVRFAGKYAQRGWETTKEATKDKRLALQSKHLRTDTGREKTKELMEEGNAFQRFRGKRRAARAALSQEVTRDRAKKKHFMHRGANGELVDNAPFINSQRLEGLLRNPRANREALAAAYDLMGEGKILPFESQAQQLLAYAEGSNLVGEYGLQKAQNKLKDKGFDGATYQAINEGMGELEAHRRLEEGLSAKASVAFETDTLADFHEGLSQGSDAGQHEEKRRAVGHWLTTSRSDQLAKEFSKANGEGKVHLARMSQAVIRSIEGDARIAAIPDWAGMDTQARTAAIGGLPDADIQAIVNDMTDGGLKRHLRRLGDPDAQRRQLSTIYRNNKNAINESAIGSLLGGTMSGGTVPIP